MRRRTPSEIKAYGDGYAEAYKQFCHLLKKNDKDKAIRKMEIFAKGVEITVETAMDEPSSSEIPNNCEDEPNCDTCRHKGVEGCEQPCLGCGCCGLYEPKIEPQIEGVWNAGFKTGYDKGYKDAQKVKDSQDLVKDLVKAFCEDGTWLERQGVYTLTLAEAKQRAVDIIESVLAKDEPTISKMEQVEDELKQFDREDLILLIECQKERIAELLAKDEPQYDFGEYADRLWKIAYERGKREALEQTEPSCDTCRLKDTTEWCKRQEVCRAYQPKDEPQTCSVNGRPYSECGSCEHFRCTADEPQNYCPEYYDPSAWE